MKYIIAVFNSRTQTLMFYNKLKAHKIACSIINNPKATSVTCGICVKFYSTNLSTARSIINNSFSGFVGFYNYLQTNNNIPVVTPF